MRKNTRLSWFPCLVGLITVTRGAVHLMERGHNDLLSCKWRIIWSQLHRNWESEFAPISYNQSQNCMDNSATTFLYLNPILQGYLKPHINTEILWCCIKHTTVKDGMIKIKQRFIICHVIKNRRFSISKWIMLPAKFSLETTYCYRTSKTIDIWTTFKSESDIVVDITYCLLTKQNSESLEVTPRHFVSKFVVRFSDEI